MRKGGEIVPGSDSVSRQLRSAASRCGRRRRAVQIGVPVLFGVPGLWLWVQLVRAGASAALLVGFGAWFVVCTGVGLLLASRWWLALLDRLPLASPECQLAYHALRLDEIAHDPETDTWMSECSGDALAALDGALRAAKALRRRFDQQTPAGIASADIADHATASAEDVRTDIRTRTEEFLGIWAALATALAGPVEPDPRPDPTRAKAAPETPRRPPADLATISRILIGLAQLAITRPDMSPRTGREKRR